MAIVYRPFFLNNLIKLSNSSFLCSCRPSGKIVLNRTESFASPEKESFNLNCKYSSCTILNPSGYSSRNHLTKMKNQLLNNSPHSFVILNRSMAGHSKWQNIRHIKAAKDAEKSKIFTKFAHLIKAAVKDGGNADIKLNQKLAVVVQQAKQKNMPMATIESAIKKSIGSKEKLEQYIVEVKGPGNCFIIVNSLTDNSARTKHQIKTILNKLSCIVLESGTARNFYDYKGIINIPISEQTVKEKALDIAIEVGAEDVVEIEDEEGVDVLQFLSDPKDFYSVKKKMEDLNFDIKFAGLEYLAHTKSTLSDADLDKASKLIDLLEDHPEVVKVYDNIA